MATELASDVREFISFLRENRLDWIADQLAAVIQEGKSVPKRVKKMKREGVTTHAFTRDEQERILLDLIEAYFVVLPKLLPSAEAALNDALSVDAIGPAVELPTHPTTGKSDVEVSERPGSTTSSRTTIVLRELDADADYLPYTADIMTDTAALASLLAAARRALPGGE